MIENEKINENIVEKTQEKHEWEEKNINKNSFCEKLKKIPKWKYMIVWFFFFLIAFWLFCYSQVKRIETLATFPAVALNVQDLVGHVSTDLEFEDINITDSKGNNVNGLYLKNDNKDAETVYYFHGNGGPLSYFYSEIKYIHSLGYNVMAYDYPGYGKSTGFPHKENVDEFSKLFYEYVQSNKNLNEKNLILWGYSIWTAVVTDFASKNDFQKLILVSPLASRYDMSEKLFWIPLQSYLGKWNSYVTKDLVKDFTQPVLIIHGNTDKIVPYKQGEIVFDNYGNNTQALKSFIEIDNFGHNGIIDIYGNALEMKIREFLRNNTLKFQKNILNTENIKSWENDTYLYHKVYTSDLDTDESLTKFVNDKVSFTNKAYVPKNLVKFGNKYLKNGKGNSTLRADILPQLNALSKSFYEQFGVRFTVNSAYRSYRYQKWIKDRGCPDYLCAKAWYSEHQSGLGFDIFAIETEQYWKNNKNLWKYFQWLKVEAPKYGFTNTYQKGKEVDGYAVEPWHWRYVGKDLALYLSKKDITFAEYYYQQKKESN